MKRKVILIWCHGYAITDEKEANRQRKFAERELLKGCIRDLLKRGKSRERAIMQARVMHKQKGMKIDFDSCITKATLDYLEKEIGLTKGSQRDDDEER